MASQIMAQMKEAGSTAKATLEIELGSVAPEGALTAPDGVRRAFCGWIELAAAIEDWWRSEAESPAAEWRVEKEG